MADKCKKGYKKVKGKCAKIGKEEKTRRTLQITFKENIPVFVPEKYKMFKKMTETIYGSKIIGAEDGKVIQ